MKIKINREDLLDAINIVSKAVSNRTTISILECVLITADNEGVRLLANDLELGIETKNIEADVIENGSVAIEAKIFSDIIRRFPDGEVLISTDSNNIATIKCNKSDYKILGQNGDEFPPLPIVDKQNGVSIPCGVLRNMIRQTNFSVSTDETRGPLTGQLFLLENGVLNLTSTDGFRISVRNMEYDGENVLKAVIPGKTLNEISKILPSDEEDTAFIYAGEKHILFELNSCTIVSRVLDGEFINYENIFTKDCTSLVGINKAELLDAIERSSLISKDVKKNPVRLTIDEGLLVISSTTDMGTAHEEISIELDGQPIDIAFNPRYLVDVLKVIDEDRISLKMTTPLSPCIIVSDENVNFKYLVLPLRIKK